MMYGTIESVTSANETQVCRRWTIKQSSRGEQDDKGTGGRGETYQDNAVSEVRGDSSVAAAECRLDLHVNCGPDSGSDSKSDCRNDGPEGGNKEGESVTDQTGDEGEQGSARSNEDQPEGSLHRGSKGIKVSRYASLLVG